MTSLPVTQPVLLRLVLQHLVERMDQGTDAMDELLRSGIDPALLDELRYIPARDLARLADNTRQPWLSLGIDCRVLRDALAKERARRQDGELESYFLEHGAPLDLIADLFKLPIEEVRWARSQLGGAVPGRPKLPPADQRPAICSEWARLEQANPDMSLRELLHQLHQRFSDHSIHALWTVINEFEAVRPTPFRRPVR